MISSQRLLDPSAKNITAYVEKLLETSDILANQRKLLLVELNHLLEVLQNVVVNMEENIIF